MANYVYNYIMYMQTIKYITANLKYSAITGIKM